VNKASGKGMSDGWRSRMNDASISRLRLCDVTSQISWSNRFEYWSKVKKFRGEREWIAEKGICMRSGERETDGMREA
jgi:hypothetical protein